MDFFGTRFRPRSFWRGSRPAAAVWARARASMTATSRSSRAQLLLKVAGTESVLILAVVNGLAVNGALPLDIVSKVFSKSNIVSKKFYTRSLCFSRCRASRRAHPCSGWPSRARSRRQCQPTSTTSRSTSCSPGQISLQTLQSRMRTG